MIRGAQITDWLKPLDTCSSQAFLTNALQVADVLEWILEQVGEATVWQTSFSISEEFLRRLFFIERSGKVKEFNLVLDHKATNKTLKLWAFIDQVIKRTFLADNHSKILLVEAVIGVKVAVITSQNLTRGNRYESTLVSTDNHIFNTLKQQVIDIIDNHSVPLNELFRERIAAD